MSTGDVKRDYGLLNDFKEVYCCLQNENGLYDCDNCPFGKDDPFCQLNIAIQDTSKKLNVSDRWDTIEDKVNRLAWYVDSLSKYERQFLLWYLLSDQFDLLELNDLKWKSDESKSSVKVLLTNLVIQRLKNGVSEIRELLAYTLWG